MRNSTGNEPQEERGGAAQAHGPVRRHAVVPLDLAGQRVDRAAAVMFDEFSRAMLSDWIQSGCLTVDGAAVRPKVKLLGGETLRLEAEITPREDWQAADPVSYQVVHADDHLLVVNKPPGLVVHPGAGNPRGTLVNGLLNDYPQLAALPRAGIVHRLDKDTSGLLLVARTLECRNRLVRMIAERAVSREYLAVVEGRLGADCTIDAPIGRDPQRRTRQAIRADGRPAVTHVRVRQRFPAHTLVEAKLETGRTHQIRVHLASRGHPLVGDSRYGARRLLPPQAGPDAVAWLRGFQRQALHAWRLGLNHPVDGAALRLQAEPPDDFTGLVRALEADGEGHDPT